jgi:hypothetical protein
MIVTRSQSVESSSLSPVLKDHIVESFRLKESPRLQFVLHRFVNTVEDECRLISFIEEQMEENETSVDFFLEFFLSVIRYAWPLRLDSLLDLKMSFRKFAANATPELLNDVLMVIQQQIVFESPILARWSAEPYDDMLGWMNWTDSEIANALTSICEPFFRSRAWEFGSEHLGPHLQHLNHVANALSMFVTASILVGCAISKKDGRSVMSRWICVLDSLLKLGNFHMLHAVFTGLRKHQVDRLSFLQENLSSGSRKTKKKMDELFDPQDRMTNLSKLWLNRSGHEPTIMSVFCSLRRPSYSRKLH